MKLLVGLMIAHLIFSSCGSSSEDNEDLGAIDIENSEEASDAGNNTNPNSDLDTENSAEDYTDAEKIINDLRSTARNCGFQSFASAPPITENQLLNQAAMGHSEDMSENNYFSHSSRDGRSPGDRISATGYETFFWSENIALGQSSLEEVMQGWIDSPGHCANIMASEPNEFGLAEVNKYWTLVFGKR